MTPNHGATAVMQMPPRARIEAALRLATERFASELSQPSGRAPDWSEFEWTMAHAAAVFHGVTPLLASLAGWRDLDQWLQFATQQRHHAALRTKRLADQLSLIDLEARHAGLAIMALKGSALYSLGLYRDGERPMADIDLLVTPNDWIRVHELLQSLGLRAVAETWKHRVFEAQAPHGEQPPDPPYGERASAPVKIEVHRHIAERLPVNQTDITEWVWPRESHSGINPYPSIAALMLHLLLHAAGNMAKLGLQLIHLHDLALVAARMRRADWGELLARRSSGQLPWWALPPLELVARYYPGRVPPAVLTRLRPLCPRSLRERARRQTISDVSFCALRLQAFPSLPWAAGLFGKVDYIRSCVRPDQDTLTARALVNREAFAADYWWRQQSQARQILHWLLARPLRPAPMHAVRAAIADQAARAGLPRSGAGDGSATVARPR